MNSAEAFDKAVAEGHLRNQRELYAPQVAEAERFVKAFDDAGIAEVREVCALIATGDNTIKTTGRLYDLAFTAYDRGYGTTSLAVTSAVRFLATKYPMLMADIINKR